MTCYLYIIVALTHQNKMLTWAKLIGSDKIKRYFFERTNRIPNKLYSWSGPRKQFFSAHITMPTLLIE